MADFKKLNHMLAKAQDRSPVPAPLSRATLNRDPFAQFAAWLEEALQGKDPQANAMGLATATNAGRPAARTVLLKAFDRQGFVFFTNYESQKGKELAQNPLASLLFYWPSRRRQVRVVGGVEKISQAASERYFHSRPRESQLGAWASPQSCAVENLAALEARMVQVRERFKKDDVIPLPPFWGGYRLRPVRFEFWQHHPYRLHDRFAYELSKGHKHTSSSAWRIQRLAP